MHHLIFNQSDPRRHIAGGIPGFVRDLVQHAPDTHTFSIVGVTSTQKEPVGQWLRVRVGIRDVDFMPIARLDASDQRRRVPHSARFLAGLLRFRPQKLGSVLHSHRVEIGAALALLFPNQAHVQFIHGDGQVALSHKAETYWRFLPRGYAAVESFAVRRADHTIVMSSSACRRLSAESDRVILGKNWFDGSCFHPADSAIGEVRVGWAGRLEPPKDPLLALAVLKALRSLGVRFSAWFAGSGTLDDRLRRSISESGLSNSVELKGTLRPDELADELRRSSVFLMTSLWEGFPRMAVESLACGVPVVSTDVGEMSTLLNQGVTGFISRTRESEDLGRLVAASTQLVRGAPISETVRHLEVHEVVPDLLQQLT